MESNSSLKYKTQESVKFSKGIDVELSNSNSGGENTNKVSVGKKGVNIFYKESESFEEGEFQGDKSKEVGVSVSKKIGKIKATMSLSFEKT